MEECKKRYPNLTLDVYAENKQAVSFYTKHGFTVTNEKENSDTKEIEYTMQWPAAEMSRYLEEKDIDNCLALMELVKDDFAGYRENEFIQAMHNAIAEKEAFIVYENNEIAGLIAFTYKNHEITFLAVNPKFRHRGIAKSLISDVIKCFSPGDMLHVVTFRGDDPKGKAAIACYHSCGFKDDEPVEVYGYPCQKMILWL